MCRDTVRYSFGQLIQQELDKFIVNWNHHRIRHSRMAEIPAGVPNVLYQFPELKGLYIVLGLKKSRSYGNKFWNFLNNLVLKIEVHFQ